MYRVVKRDGKVTGFNISKISDAIKKVSDHLLGIVQYFDAK